eukprot:31423_1
MSVQIALLKLLKVDDKGWRIGLFDNQIKITTYLCNHCNAVCCDAVELACDHEDIDIFAYCKKCLADLIDDNDGKCPINKHINPIVSAARSIRRQISEATVICPHSCEFQRQNSKHIVVNEHIIDSIVDEGKEGVLLNPYVEIKGCQWKGSLTDLLNFDHLRKCIVQYNPTLELKLKLDAANHKINEQSVMIKNFIRIIDNKNHEISKLKQQIVTMNSALRNAPENDSQDEKHNQFVGVSKDVNESEIQKQSLPLILTRTEWQNGATFKFAKIKTNKNNSSLSTRDAASYITLSNFAVSELLQQTDITSKEYWVPIETKMPRGIFGYNYMYQKVNYHHYMAKAILHHEPKFIYDVICDPAFRFVYDKMLEEMLIIDKLDANTRIVRYLHSNSQFFTTTKRESLLVIKNRCIIPNEKYIAAGISAEHKDFPTEISVKTFQNADNVDMSKSFASKGPSKSFASKGPSKSLDNIVRMDCKSSGWVIEKHAKKSTDSIVSYITNVNFGGSVMSAILKQIAKRQMLAVFYLGKALKQKANALKKKKMELRKQQLQQMQMKQETQYL